MQCPTCLQYRHDGDCEPYPTELDMLEAAKENTFAKWINLIHELPITGRTAEQESQINEVRLAALAARDRWLDKGGQ